LLAYDWPGNVRELRNFVESMVVVDYDGMLDLDDLPSELADAAPASSDEPTSGVGLSSLIGRPLEDVERMFILATLDSVAGHREEAAKMLAIGERTLYRKIKEYGV
jgi:two-component system response regulator HydG